MPFVDLSSPVQNLQNSVDSNAVQPVQSDGQDDTNQQQNNQQDNTNQQQQDNNQNDDQNSNTQDTSIVDKLSSSTQQKTDDSNQASDDQSNSDDDVKVTEGPQIPQQSNNMPPVVNAGSVGNGGQQNANTQQQQTQQAAPASVTGAEKLPPLNEILSDGDNSIQQQTNMNQNTNQTGQQTQQNQQPQTQQNQNTQLQQQNQPTNTNVNVGQIPPINDNNQTNPPSDSKPQTQQQQQPKPADSPKPGVQSVEFDFNSFDPKTASMEEFMSYTIAADASDLHLSAGNPTMVRVSGDLKEIQGDVPSNEKVEELVKQIVSDEEFKSLQKERELDVSYAHSSGNRFRVNVFMAQGEWAAALRLIPQKIRTIAELNLPDIIYDFTKIPQGLIIVAGPTGSGKSTTLASMLQEINLNRAEHILTIENPIEYVYPKAKSRVDQRELGKDTLSWKNALRAALRQDPNVVLVGEMRDYETIEATVTVAETGHLVFATLHTNSAAQTVDRIIDVFPEGQQPQIRAQLSNVLSAVISQRLIKVKSGGRRAVQEIMVATTAVKNAIREGKTYQIDNMIQTSSESGMQTLESNLVKLVREGVITVEEAEANSVKVEELRSLLKSN